MILSSQFEHRSDLKIQEKTFFRTLKLSIPPSNLYQEMELGLSLLFSFLRLRLLLLFFYLYCESREKLPGSSRRALNRRPGSIREPDTYSFQVIFATFVAMDDSGGRGCWAGRKEEDSPSLAFLLNHLPLCATNSRSLNLLQNFLKVARSYCSKKFLLKLNQNDGNFSFFLQDKCRW